MADGSAGGVVGLDVATDRLTSALPDLLEIPTDRLRVVDPSGEHHELVVAIDAPTRAAMEALAADAQATPIAVLVGLLHALLARYTRDPAVAVAVPDGLGWSVVPCEGEAETAVVTLIQRASAIIPATLGRARSRSDTGARHGGKASLVQVVAHVDACDGDASEPVGLDLEGATELAFVVGNAGSTLRIRYRPELFDPATVGRIAGHLGRLAMAAAAPASREIPASALDILEPAERHQLIARWNDTDMVYPDRSFPALFSERAAAAPHRIAVECAGRSITYGELDEASNRVARALIDLGVVPGALIGICLDRSIDMIIGLLGIMKTGAAYVPIDPAFPAERIGWMVEDSAAPVIVTQSSLVGLFERSGRALLCLDADAELIARSAAAPIDVVYDASRAVYVIFTSGSTGRPKGVMIPNRALVNFLATMAREPGLDEHDTLVAVTTLSFDIAGLELYLPLLVGGRLVIATREQAADGRALAGLIESSGATVVQATPATWRLLVDTGWTGNRPTPSAHGGPGAPGAPGVPGAPGDGSEVREGLKALCGGEALPPGLAQQLLERCRELWNVYGPTETTIWSTCERVVADRPITIGHPIGNTQLYIVDDRLAITPVGVPGELCIGGDGVAIGYLDRPELTAERFVADPYRQGARIYRTGDLARWRPDGTVEFMGRLDHQVKIRGFRIELGEIETRLAHHAGVRVCVVVAVDEAQGEKRLVAYFEPVAEALPDARELREHLAQTLPVYMIPAIFQPVDALPLTPNGKIDRNRLPAPDVRPETLAGQVDARDELEAQLVTIWQDVLKITPIGVTDDFFDLGVSSIGAARLFAEIEKRIGSQLPLGAVFQAPTIEKLAALVRGSEPRNEWTSLIPVQTGGSQAPFFCVHGGAGTVLHLQPLARALGRDQPFYAFQAQGLYGDRPPHATIEAMAAHYVVEMRTVQPQGPYLLGGYCFGAIVAWEMALQLHAAGQGVSLLAMFNGASSDYIRRQGTLLEQAEQARSQTRARSVGWRGRTRRHGVRAYVFVRRRVRRWRRAVARRHILATGRCVPEHLRDMFFIDMGHILEGRYQLRAWRGEALVFAGGGLYREPELGWGGLGATLHLVEVGEHHRDQRDLMGEPAVAEVARELDRRLRECDPVPALVVAP